MPDATVANATIRPGEAAHFGRQAHDWWDPDGSSAMLHRLNPVPLACKAALDVGCGAGLLCEPLARLGAGVTGVDAAPENVEAAARHAEGSGLDIRYVSGELATLGLGAFDVVTC